MNKLITLFSLLRLAACNPASDKKSDSQDEAAIKALSDIKVPVYAWMGGPGRDTDKEINAAVFPGPNSVARKIVRQEWDKWNADAFYPMNYNDFYLKGTKWIGEVSNEGVTAINNRKPLYSCLFICPRPESKADEPDPEGHCLVPEELEEAIRESMENGAAGVCLFTPGRMTDEHWKVLETAIRKDFSK